MTRAWRCALPAAVILAAACAPARGVATARTTPAGAEPAATTPAAAKEPIQRHRDRMRWIEGPPAVPGSRMAILEGNPKEAGAIFTLRLSVKPGTKLPPHVHPQDERVTVIDGSVLVGFGETFDESAGTRFRAGDFYVNPAGLPHYVWTDEPATLQMTGLGPWEVRLVAP